MGQIPRLASILVAVTAIEIVAREGLTPLSQQLPFYAYPFRAITLRGSAWMHVRSQRVSNARGLTHYKNFVVGRS
jgi:hypothetical protein